MTEYSKDNSSSYLLEKARGAILGAAVGDALGWPYELRSGRVAPDKISAFKNGSLHFQDWERRTGGRFYPHAVNIRSGEYSDDTQLILSTARSLLLGKENWQKYFSERELPLWLIYERGGGGATKRAAKSWLSGKKPWSKYLKKKDTIRYFKAGGNGVAMRILPHLISKSDIQDFKIIGEEIFRNGICTHGHPRALLGAIAYSYALWVAMRESKILRYGELIEELLSSINVWGEIKELSEKFSKWFNVANKCLNNEYFSIWKRTITEMKELLEIGRKSLRKEALADDIETLDEMGCFNKKIGGAGTVTAASSIFLASRHAVAPIHALSASVLAKGADTDTIASMTGALLGAINGVEWLQPLCNEIQDTDYLNKVAKSFYDKDIRNQLLEFGIPKNINKMYFDEIDESISQSKKGDTISLSKNHMIKVLDVINHKMKSRKIEVTSRKIEIFGGQTAYVKKIKKKEAPLYKVQEKVECKAPGVEILSLPISPKRIGVKIRVRDFRTSRDFYEKVLGLNASKESTKSVTFGGIMTISQISMSKKELNNLEPDERKKLSAIFTICIETEDIERIFNDLKQYGATLLDKSILTDQKNGIRYFRCLDPEQNILEIMERVECKS